MKYPDYPYRVWVEFKNVRVFTQESEELFYNISEWCLRSDIHPLRDIESYMAKGEKDSDPEVYPPFEPIRWIVFCFKDPAKASQFKLAWG